MRSLIVEKAQLFCLDKKEWSIRFRLNPSSLNLSCGAHQDTQDVTDSSSDGVKEYRVPPEDTLTFEMVLDESISNEKVKKNHAFMQEMMSLAGRNPKPLPNNETSILTQVRGFHQLANPIIVDGNEPRQPLLAFSWKDFEFKGMIESFSCAFTLFDHGGRAKRATLEVTMKGEAFSERISPEDYLSGERKVVSAKKTITVKAAKAGSNSSDLP